MDFVVYQSVEDVKKFQNYAEQVAEHFGSDMMAEHYLNGFIDWDGRAICDYHGSGPCNCEL
jgi:hypothetical protein